jgi:acyl-coenzyme A synthetase/AMP-(fatty) acid ligase/acyl carrier protein
LAEFVTLDTFGDTSDDDPGVVIAPESRALVYLTSGSTGSPKTVAHTHASVVRQLWQEIVLTEMTPEDRVAVLFPLAFLGGVVIFGAALLTGARACLYDIGSLGIDGLPPWLAARGVTQLSAVPSVLYALADSLERGGDALPQIRNIGFGGEEFRPTALPALRRAFPAARLWNGYGGQECGSAAAYVVPGDADGSSGRLPAGHVLPTYRVVVVDEAGDPLPQGECGEIVVSGPNVAHSYGRDEDSATTRSLSDDRNEASVRTGDLGLIRADGLLDVLGRLDRRVKVRGQAVDVVEVERALSGLEEVRDAVVTPAVDDRAALRLVAHVVTTAGSTPTVGELRRGLERELPRYAIPSVFVFVSSIPLTPRGKVDRAALGDAALDAVRRDAEYVAPSTRQQRRLVELFAAVLDIDPEEIGALDDFFDLGGDSLDATELLAAIADEFGAELAVSTLLECPTPTALDTAIARRPLEATTVVRLRQGPPEPTPFFCVARGLDHALSLRGLAHALTNRTVFGIHAKDVDGRGRPPDGRTPGPPPRRGHPTHSTTRPLPHRRALFRRHHRVRDRPPVTRRGRDGTDARAARQHCTGPRSVGRRGDATTPALSRSRPRCQDSPRPPARIHRRPPSRVRDPARRRPAQRRSPQSDCSA